MLVLMRRVGEEIKIGPDITLTVVAIAGKQVQLGISAPRSVEIQRDNIKNKTPKPTGEYQ